MLKRIGLIVLLTGLSGAASATTLTCKYFLGIPYDCKPVVPVVPVGPAIAPEIDLGSTAAGLTLALGGLVVLRARRVRSEK